MKIVADSNIIFSALISGKELYLEIFQTHKVYVPDIVLDELLKYESRIIKKSKIKQERFRSFIQMLFERITVIPKFAISPSNWQRAYSFCKDIDEKDTPFVALSLELNVPLLTNDKALINAVKSKGFSKLITFEELLRDLPY